MLITFIAFSVKDGVTSFGANMTLEAILVAKINFSLSLINKTGVMELKK